jgi:acetyl-CoA carboxylase biotin carboxyl carrier protein
MAHKRPPASGADDSDRPPRPFDVGIIKTLVGLMNQHDLSEIDLHEGEQRIRLRRGTQQQIVQTVSGSAAPVAAAPSAPASSSSPAADAKPAKPAKAGQIIKSPTPGTFYASPSPGAPPFASVGTRVTPETVVCIIEAMKILNEIPAECSGVITKVLVENQQPVEYGQALFEVDPAG